MELLSKYKRPKLCLDPSKRTPKRPLQKETAELLLIQDEENKDGLGSNSYVAKGSADDESNSDD